MRTKALREFNLGPVVHKPETVTTDDIQPNRILVSLDAVSYISG